MQIVGTDALQQDDRSLFPLNPDMIRRLRAHDQAVDETRDYPDQAEMLMKDDEHS